MLGFGHNPKSIIEAMSEPQVMANIMTPSFQHQDFMDAIRWEIGHSRSADSPVGKTATEFQDQCPYVCATACSWVPVLLHASLAPPLTESCTLCMCPVQIRRLRVPQQRFRVCEPCHAYHGCGRAQHDQHAL